MREYNNRRRTQRQNECPEEKKLNLKKASSKEMLKERCISKTKETKTFIKAKRKYR